MKLQRRLAQPGKKRMTSLQWWMDANGKMIPVSNHVAWAEKSGLIKRGHPIYGQMYELGYLRLTTEKPMAGPPILWVASDRKPNRSQFGELESYGIENEAKVIFENDIGALTTLYEPPV